MKVRKWLPQIIIASSYSVIALLFFSSLGMIGVLLINKGDMSRAEAGKLFRELHYLMPFYQAPLSIPVFLVFGGLLFCLVSWLFTTRVQTTNKGVGRRAFFFLFAWFTATLLFTSVAAAWMKPISYDRLMNVDKWVTEPRYREYLHPGSLRMLGGLMMMLPFIAFMKLWAHLLHEYRSDPLVKEWFATYQFQSRFLGRFGDEKANETPDITLAKDAETGAPVVLSGESRQLGTGLIGPPGSGKTALKIIVGFKQDMRHMIKAINAFPGLIKKHGLNSENFHKAWAKYLIGSIVIEPAKDLCDKAYKEALESGIPKELITYLDPSDPDTPGFNSMVGPVEQVAEMIAQVLDSISETTDEFFKQSCRVVVKMYVYLLKFLHKNECTLPDLDEMYQDPTHTFSLVEDLEDLIPTDEVIRLMPKDKRIYWMLARRTVQWFYNDGLEVATDRSGQTIKHASGRHKGRPVIKDKQFEFTRQTRNLLSDMIMNPYLARILTAPNEVNLDRLMARGGILLTNTANGQLGQAMSNAFGKLVLISAQNAVFRRKGDEGTRSLISAWIDEFRNYLTKPFLDLSAEGRKYKFATFVATQSLAQFDLQFGNGFTEGMLGTVRNWIVYGGVGSRDGEMLAKEFGMRTVEELSFRESITPETMNNPGRSFQETVAREQVEVATADEIMFNPFKVSYIKMVVEKSTKRALKAVGDFVDTGSKVKLDQSALAAYLSYWQDFEKEAYAFDMDWIDEVGQDSQDRDAEHLALMAIQKREDGALDENKGEDIPASVAHTPKPVTYIGASRFIEIEKKEPMHPWRAPPPGPTPQVATPSPIMGNREPVGPHGTGITTGVTAPKGEPVPSMGDFKQERELVPIVGDQVVQREEGGEAGTRVPQPSGPSASQLLFGVKVPSHTVASHIEVPDNARHETINVRSDVTESGISHLDQALPNEPVTVEKPTIASATPPRTRPERVSPEEEELKKKMQIMARRLGEQSSKSKIDSLKPAKEVDKNNPMIKALFNPKKRP